MTYSVPLAVTEEVDATRYRLPQRATKNLTDEHRWMKSLGFLLALCMLVTLTVFTAKWALWSLLAEIVTTADRFQKTRRSCKRTDFSSLDWLRQRALVLLQLPMAQMELSDGAEDLCEKWRSDISVLHQTVSKIKGPWKQTIQTVISLVLTKKQTNKQTP